MPVWRELEQDCIVHWYHHGKSWSNEVDRLYVVNDGRGEEKLLCCLHTMLLLQHHACQFGLLSDVAAADNPAGQVHVLLENVARLGWPPGVFVNTSAGIGQPCPRCTDVSCWAVHICDGALMYPSLCAFLPRFERLVILAVLRNHEAQAAAYYARFRADGMPLLEIEVSATEQAGLQRFFAIFGFAHCLLSARTADESTAKTELHT